MEQQINVSLSLKSERKKKLKPVDPCKLSKTIPGKNTRHWCQGCLGTVGKSLSTVTLFKACTMNLLLCQKREHLKTVNPISFQKAVLFFFLYMLNYSTIWNSLILLYEKVYQFHDGLTSQSSDFQPLSSHGTHKLISTILRHTQKYILCQFDKRKIGSILVHSQRTAIVE